MSAPAHTIVFTQSGRRGEVPDGEVEPTLRLVKHVMEEAPKPAVALSVPLQVDARAADNWDEAH